MSPSTLDTLLEKLATGDSDAAERIFRGYEPFLRAMVRRKITPPLRSKFDSMDVVQSVWADVLKGFRGGQRQFTDREHLRAFLAKVTYNHFVNHCRRHGRELDHEQSLNTDEPAAATQSLEPRPSQVVRAEELWETMVGLCPPQHRQILDLKRQGLSLVEIANQTGLHEGSVRRILYDLARRLAAAGVGSDHD
jgi:RNA polymerase sigma-70 factor (ECF subfamily)